MIAYVVPLRYRIVIRPCETKPQTTTGTTYQVAFASWRVRDFHPNGGCLATSVLSSRSGCEDSSTVVTLVERMESPSLDWRYLS